MKRESAGPILTTVFVDYDNIYLSLKRKSEDAAKRFAKDSGAWLQAIVSGELITPTSSHYGEPERRLVMSRCYGNPVPRRNAHDNSTDMNSFPFVRHHFLRAGFEVIDCAPLTAQLKNSADIRIVMDIRDLLTHDTFFDEFIVMSGDADFTPVMHRLRAHARRTVVFANEQTAQPYTALSDGEIRESSLIELLLGNRALKGETTTAQITTQAAALPAIDLGAARTEILNEVSSFVRAAPQAVPLETLADRAVRVIGRDKTIGTNWVGYGSFRDLLLANLSDDLHLSDTPPYTVFDASKHISSAGLISPPAAENAGTPIAPPAATVPAQRPVYAQQPAPQPQPAMAARSAQQRPPASHAAPAAPQPAQTAPPAYREPIRTPAPGTVPAQAQRPVAPPPPMAPAAPRSGDQAAQIQQSIARIHDACQAPALAPAEYRVLFDIMAQEIGANGLQGSQTLANLTQRAREFGLDLKRDDLRFILEVVSESDPWFEQGVSANLFASRFRNFVVSRCRSQGLSLSADELDLIEAWFSAQPPQQARTADYSRTQQQPAAPAAQQRPAQSGTAHAPNPNERWWALDDGQPGLAAERGDGTYGAGGPAGSPDDEFPRIVRTRFRG
jgi:hypothetical protein